VAATRQETIDLSAVSEKGSRLILSRVRRYYARCALKAGRRCKSFIIEAYI